MLKIFLFFDIDDPVFSPCIGIAFAELDIGNPRRVKVKVEGCNATLQWIRSVIHGLSGRARWTVQVPSNPPWVHGHHDVVLSIRFLQSSRIDLTASPVLARALVLQPLMIFVRRVTALSTIRMLYIRV